MQDDDVSSLTETIKFMRWTYLFLVVMFVAQVWVTVHYRNLAEEWRKEAEQALATSNQGLEVVHNWEQMYSELVVVCGQAH